MRFLIITREYPEFLSWLYAEHPGLEKQAYDEQMRVRMDTLCGTADFYSSNLRKLGHEAWDVYFNNEFMQRAWAREQGVRVEEPTQLHQRLGDTLQPARRAGDKTRLRHARRLVLPLLRWLDSRGDWLYDVLLAQARHYRPDVILIQFVWLNSAIVKELKPHARLLVGQHASPLPQRQDFGLYDLMLSSLPNLVDYFAGEGIPSELHRWCFEPAVLERLGVAERCRLASFVGSLSAAHESRLQWLDYVCRRMPVEVWAQDIDGLPGSSPIFKYLRGTAWGLDMYRILRDSRITLNHHIDMARSYANNMRLFEATGVGTLLITDWKQSLQEMFEPGKEVVAYRSPQECVDLVQYFLEHEDERSAIAQAGQQRTLREHTYYHRAQELADIVHERI